MVVLRGGGRSRMNSWRRRRGEAAVERERGIGAVIRTRRRRRRAKSN